MFTLGFIGVGHIASSLIEGFLDSGAVAAGAICAYDPRAEVGAKLASMGIRSLSDECAVVSESKIVIIAVRPSEVPAVMEKIKDRLTFNNVLVSLAAGVPMATIKRYLGKECKLIRAIPNVAARFCSGVTALSYEMPITYQELQAVKDLFDCVGILRVVDEEKLNDYIAAASSSPAYFYYLTKALADGAAAQGIDSETAELIAAQTLIGAAKILENSRKSAGDLLSEVATPKGTTAEALNVLEKSGLPQTVADAMLACTKRANDMDSVTEFALEQ